MSALTRSQARTDVLKPRRLLSWFRLVSANFTLQRPGRRVVTRVEDGKGGWAYLPILYLRRPPSQGRSCALIEHIKALGRPGLSYVTAKMARQAHSAYCVEVLRRRQYFYERLCPPYTRPPPTMSYHLRINRYGQAIDSRPHHVANKSVPRPPAKLVHRWSFGFSSPFECQYRV